jgi:hypothetical protein
MIKPDGQAADRWKWQDDADFVTQTSTDFYSQYSHTAIELISEQEARLAQ